MNFSIHVLHFAVGDSTDMAIITIHGKYNRLKRRIRRSMLSLNLIGTILKETSPYSMVIRCVGPFKAIQELYGLAVLHLRRHFSVTSEYISLASCIPSVDDLQMVGVAILKTSKT